MRRSLGMLVVVALFLPALAALANTENVRDDFGSVSYSGNDGSLDFAGPWSEIGEGDGAATGQVLVADQNCSNNRCLQFRGGILGTVGASRSADLSEFTTAQLEFDMVLQGALLSVGTLNVQVKGNGRNWTTLDSYGLLGESGAHSEGFDVSSFAGSDFGLRFRLTSLLGGDRVYIDRVNIEGAVAPVTTTTTSTSSTTSSSSSSSSSTSTSTSIFLPLPIPVGPTTSTTAPRSTTSTTDGRPDGSTSTTEQESSGSTSTSSTSTTVASSTITTGGSATTTTVAGTSTTSIGVPGAVAPPPPPISRDGLRDPGVGLMADYRSGMMGDVGEVEVLGVDLEADFSIAAELFEVARIWIAILALLLTAALVSGMDWKRSRPEPAE